MFVSFIFKRFTVQVTRYITNSVLRCIKPFPVVRYIFAMLIIVLLSINIYLESIVIYLDSLAHKVCAYIFLNSFNKSEYTRFKSTILEERKTIYFYSIYY